MKLSKNFSLSEFTRSRTARIKGINNKPCTFHIDNLKKLCENVLQPLRDYMNEPIKINSGFRTNNLNIVIGGSKTSSHMKGEASDIECDNDKKNVKMFIFILENLDFDQLIIYKSIDGVPRFVHVSYSQEVNRKQAMIKRDNGGYEFIYVNAVKNEFPKWI